MSGVIPTPLRPTLQHREVGVRRAMVPPTGDCTRLVMTKAAPSFRSDDQRWAAIVRRNRAADGLFFYAVLTTGVYCRPSCASRLPRRENVQFHATADEAERAGFRACKRCQPRGKNLDERQAAAVAQACRLIERAEEMPSLDALADAAGMRRLPFHRVVQAQKRGTPKAHARTHPNPPG